MELNKITKKANKTAVEWLEEQIRWRTDINDIIKKAKEMEKQQLNEAFKKGFGMNI